MWEIHLMTSLLALVCTHVVWKRDRRCCVGTSSLSGGILERPLPKKRSQMAATRYSRGSSCFQQPGVGQCEGCLYKIIANPFFFLKSDLWILWLQHHNVCTWFFVRIPDFVGNAFLLFSVLTARRFLRPPRSQVETHTPLDFGCGWCVSRWMYWWRLPPVPGILGQEPQSKWMGKVDSMWFDHPIRGWPSFHPSKYGHGTQKSCLVDDLNGMRGWVKTIKNCDFALSGGRTFSQTNYFAVKRRFCTILYLWIGEVQVWHRPLGLCFRQCSFLRLWDLYQAIPEKRQKGLIWICSSTRCPSL